MKKLLGNNTKGVIAYGDNVLFSIIQLATLEISGVDSLVGKGVKMNIAAGIVNVSVTIKVRADVSCADVAFRVQNNIKRTLETTTDFKAGTIDVNIVGVEYKEYKDINTL